MNRRIGALLFLSSLLVARSAAADDFDGTASLTLDQIAAIKADQDRAKKQITEKYRGDDTADRREVKREIRDALQTVLDEHGVDKGTFLKQLTHVSKDEKEAIETKSKAINEARDPTPPKPADEWSTETATASDKPSSEKPSGETSPAKGQSGEASATRTEATESSGPVTAESEPIIIRGYSDDHPLEIVIQPEGEAAQGSKAP